MALEVGELVARTSVDNSGLEQGLADGEQSASNFGEKFGAIMAAAGAVAAVALGAALVGALNQQQIGGKIAANFGETSKEAGYWGKLAGDLYSNGFGQSVAEVGDAITAIRKQGLIDGNSSADEVKKISEQAMTLSDVFGYDVTGSARAAQQMILNGLAPSAEAAFDVITYGAQNGIDKSEDLLDTFNEYSTKFRDLGIDAKQALGLMSQGLKAGARDSDVVADSLKELVNRMRDGSAVSDAGFKNLGLSGTKMTAAFAKGGDAARGALDSMLDRLRAIKDPAERNAAATALFGTKFEDVGNAIFALDLDKATNGMDKLAGSTKRAGEASAASNIEVFKRKLEMGFVSIVGGKVLPLLSSLVNWLANVGQWWQKNAEWLNPLAIGLGTFAGVVATVILVQKAWIASTAAVKAAWLALNSSFVMSPIGLVIAAIIALVAVFIYLWVKCRWFRDFWIEWGNGLKGAALAIAHWFAGPFAQFFVRAWNAIKHGTGAAVDWIKSKWAIFVAGLSLIKSKVGSIFGAIAGFVSGAFSRATGIVRGSINSVVGVVNGAISGLNYMSSIANKIPGVNIPHIPSLPRLAQGGIVSPTAGGRPVVMGDGREVEIGLPASGVQRFLRLAGVTPGAGGATELRVVLDPGGAPYRAVTKTLRLRAGAVETMTVSAV